MANLTTLRGNWDYAQALQELWQRSSYERGLISDPFGDVERAERGLVRIRALLAELGDPQHRVPAVHIAGSKGKGSTGAFIASAAVQAGYKVGFYTSPHLHRFPERIAIDGSPLADDAFAAVAHLVARAAAKVDARTPGTPQVSTFEMITAMAFVAFAERACDLAVIEVGLGGRYDSTNVLLPLVTAITRIDLEHTAVLGPTHAEIALQKAGIMRPGVPCVSSPQVAAAAAAIVRAAAAIGAPLLMGRRDWTWSGTWRAFEATGPWGAWDNLRLGIPGPHQVENACTALAALHVINAPETLISEESVRAGLANTRWPGRFEHVEIDGQDIVFDAAHTPAAAAALVETWRDARLPILATVIVGMGTDKNPRSFLENLAPLIGHLLVTRADSPRAANPEIIAAAAAALAIPFTIVPSVAAAISAARESSPAPLLVTGSLFVAGEGREALGLAAPDLFWRALNEAHTPDRGAPNRA